MDTPIPQNLSVTLTMTAELLKTLQTEQGAKDVALAYEIDSSDMAVAANEELKSIKRRIKIVTEWRAKFIEPANTMVENANALFNPALESLAAGESLLKVGLQSFQAKEAARIEQERRAAEEVARKARQEAEQKAAAERARAAQQAEEANRQAAEAEQARLKAVAEGNSRAAAAAAAESARLQEKAQSIVETGEAKAEAVQIAAATMEAAPVATVTKIAGFTTRKNWIAELATDEQTAKKLICEGIAAGRTELYSMIDINMPAANKMAKALEGNFNVPGLKAYNNPVAASRASR